MAMPEKITAWKDDTERFGSWHETQAGQGASGDERFYIRADLVDELVKALEAFQGYGCPVCHGDCASANPPVNSCPMQMAHAALTRIKGDGK